MAPHVESRSVVPEGSPDRVLALNVGSSSVKFAVYDAVDTEAPARHLKGQVVEVEGDLQLEANTVSGAQLAQLRLCDEMSPEPDHKEILDKVFSWLEGHVGPLDAFAGVAHRVVHDAGQFAGPTHIGPDVIERLARLNPLAPEHQPQNLEGIRFVADHYPNLPQIACFDTTFHDTMPWAEKTFALPRDYFDRGLRRFGFHGLSYAYIMHVLPTHFDRAAEAKVIVAHLGHGASMCAVQEGKSIATTMGLTPLDGLPMGRRCGRLDPGLVPHLIGEEGCSLDDVLELLYQQSGLLGVSGVSSDMRVLVDSKDEAAERAVELFVYAARKEIGALVACLEGLDALVFTGGIGENSSEIRARICDGLGWLGVRIEPSANAAGAAEISQASSDVRVFTLPTDEEFVLARDALRALV